MMKVVTANRLRDGRVVFLSPKGAWALSIVQAALFEDKSALEEALLLAHHSIADNRIVDPYDVDVRIENNIPIPLRLRERIRTNGPTTGSDIDKTAVAA